MKRIYVASPYTYKGGSKGFFGKVYARLVEWQRFIQITRIQGRLVQQYGVACYGPILESHLMVFLGNIFGDGLGKVSGKWADWEEYDLTMIDGCDEMWVVTMEGYDKSTGVTAEIKHCNFTGKPVRYVHPETLALTKGVKNARTTTARNKGDTGAAQQTRDILSDSRRSRSHS